ncbi:hypothetical protein N7493_011116 [Penicillium malachiteum]|uniref:C2H2-type domain-containing protein n=1 Tax=Penicillium malachiteum TaxID=1324776 RepID=A0AAD6HBS4_9EURO|nr:hypothetical protein N7493_011116 [Penicillium malachiteum]
MQLDGFSWSEGPPQPGGSSQTSSHPERLPFDTPSNQQGQSSQVPGSPPHQEDFAGIGLGVETGPGHEQFIQFHDPVGEALHLTQGYHDDPLISQREQDANFSRSSRPQETRINGQLDGQSQCQLDTDTVTREMGPFLENQIALLDRSRGIADPAVFPERYRQLSRLWRMLQELDTQNITVQSQQPQTPVEQQTPSVVTNEAVTTLYTCWICRATFRRLTCFQRHVESLHIQKCMYVCDYRGCRHRDPRRDRMRDHYLQAHTLRPTPQQLNGMKVDIPPPGICYICTQVVRNWQEFYRCWISHCTFPPGHNGPPGDGDDDDPGNGGADPSPGNESRPAGRGGSGAGMRPPSPASRGPRRGGATQRRGQNRRSVDALSPIVTRAIRRPASTRGDTQPNTPSTQDGRRQSVGEIIPPRLAQHNDTTRTHQPADQARPLPRESLHCRRCNHIFVACSECCFLGASTYGCHICSQALRNISLTARMELAMRGDSYQIAFLSVPDPQLQANIGGTVQDAGFTQYGGPFAHHHHLDHHPHGRGGGGSASFGGSNFNVGVLVALVPENHLEENEVDLYNSKSLASQLSATLLDLPTMSLLHKGMPELLQMRSSVADCMYNKSSLISIWSFASAIFAHSNKINDSLGKDPSIRAIQPFPAPERPVPQSPMCSPSPPIGVKSHKGQTRLELAPGKVLCVDMKVLPEERGAHQLRTRVRVLVKLLKLRSSVARAGNKKKTKEDADTLQQALCTSFNHLNLGSESVKIVDDKDESPSDADSEADDLFSDTKSEASSASEASISDHALLLNEKAELFDEFETEFELPMDIEVGRLSTWTDAFADLEAKIEDTKMNDNAWVFEILLRCILYVIFGSRRFLKHGSYPKLLE